MKDGQVAYDSRMFQPGWSPPARIAAAGLGLSALYAATRVSRSWKVPLVGLGASVLLRAVTNRYMTELLGLLANPVITLRREIRIRASSDTVFDFLKNFSNYPRFMSHVRAVHLNDQGNLQWSLEGPGKMNIEWQASIGPLLTNQVIAWQSLPGSPLHASGMFRFHETREMHTVLDVQLSYAPPAGVLGGMVAHVLGFDPSDKIDEDLHVLKSLVERSAPNYLEMVGSGHDE